jgi:hypothetical protein
MTIKQSILRFVRLGSILSFFLATNLTLSSCSGLENIPNTEPDEPVSVFTGKPGGIKLSGLLEKDQPDVSMPVNALLWRAALDIASFLPLDDIDTFGGSIVTEWYQSANTPNQRLKLAIFVRDLELRSDAVKVHTYTQQKANNVWIDSGRDEALARKLEDLILTRAREIRSASISETN